jgi:predicted Zn-dependent protease
VKRLILLRPHSIIYFLQNILGQKLLKKSTSYQKMRLDFFDNFWYKRCGRNMWYYVVGVIYIFIFYILLAANNSALASHNLSFIRDAETEKFLHDIETPIIRAANLNINDIKVYIVNDREINAFVSNGQNIFVNTGLVRKFNTPDALIGVLAHETGHIAAGHIARNSEQAQDISKQMIISYLLGIGAMLGGQGDIGSAVIFGSIQSYQGLYIKYSRGQEEAADKLAVNYLDKIQYPATGLLNLLQSFKRDEIGIKNQEINEFYQSHPITTKRIDFIKSHIELTRFDDTKINQPLLKQMSWVLVKLEAFIDNPDQLVSKYQNLKDSDLKFYGLSIAYYRLGKTNQAIKNIDKVIANNPGNGFLYELKAQILFESGDIVDAVLNYHQAIKLIAKKDNFLIRISLSNAIIALNSNDQELLQLAISYLKSALIEENDNPLIFRSLAAAYSQIGDKGRYYLALADFNLLIGSKETAIKFAKLAKESLEKNAVGDLMHADDINSAK